MLGLLTDQHSYIARTDVPLLIESLDLYQSIPSMIPSRCISISTKFGICTSFDNLSQMHPIFPNELIERDKLSSGEEIYYASKVQLKKDFTSLHFRALCQKIANYYFDSTNNNLFSQLHFIILIREHAIFFQARKTAVEYCQIYNYDQDLELLFHINRFFVDQKLEFANEKIIVLGEVDPKIKIFNIFQNYCKNILADDFNPLSLLDQYYNES